MGFTFIFSTYFYTSVQSFHIFSLTHSHMMAESHHLITSVMRVADNKATGPEVEEEET